MNELYKDILRKWADFYFGKTPPMLGSMEIRRLCIKIMMI